MERLFLDTNVVLDLLGERAHFYDAAAKIASLADQSKVELVVSSLTFATTFYILSKYESKSTLIEKIRKFKVLTKTADLTDEVLDKGLNSEFTDFEDALQYFCALKMNSDLIITRNEKDFKSSLIPVMSPTEYLSRISSI